MQTEEHVVPQLSPALGAQESRAQVELNGLPRNILRFPIERCSKLICPRPGGASDTRVHQNPTESRLMKSDTERQNAHPCQYAHARWTGSTCRALHHTVERDRECTANATNLNVSARFKRQVCRSIALWFQPDFLPIHTCSTELLEWDDTAGMRSVLTLRKCRMCRQPCATPWTTRSKHRPKSSSREAVRESLDSLSHGSRMWLLRMEQWYTCQVRKQMSVVNDLISPRPP